MLTIESSSGHQAILTPCLQLRFEWMSTHWKHEMVSCGPCAPIPRVWSIEGGHAADDPRRVSGPIYQQIDVRPDPTGIARALLVGQSGPHHFSASFAVQGNPDGVVIDVDVADRCLTPVEALAATYLIEASGAAIRSDDAGAELSWHHPETRLIFEAEPPTRVAAAEASMGSIRLQALAAIEPTQKTHRFRYRWRWIHSPEHWIGDRTA
jgi:hypothetical protein